MCNSWQPYLACDILTAHVHVLQLGAHTNVLESLKTAISAIACCRGPDVHIVSLSFELQQQDAHQQVYRQNIHLGRLRYVAATSVETSLVVLDMPAYETCHEERLQLWSIADGKRAL